MPNFRFLCILITWGFELICTLCNFDLFCFYQITIWNLDLLCGLLTLKVNALLSNICYVGDRYVSPFFKITWQLSSQNTCTCIIHLLFRIACVSVISDFKCLTFRSIGGREVLLRDIWLLSVFYILAEDVCLAVVMLVNFPSTWNMWRCLLLQWL